MPHLRKKLAFLISYAVLALSLLLLNLPRYMEIRKLDAKLVSSLKSLEKSYNEYIDQKKTLDMIKTRMKNLASFEDLKKIVPKGVSFTKKEDRIFVKGLMTPEEFNEIIDFVLRTSNMAVYSVDVKNEFRSPFVVGEDGRTLIMVDMEIFNPEVIR